VAKLVQYSDVFVILIHLDSNLKTCIILVKRLKHKTNLYNNMLLIL